MIRLSDRNTPLAIIDYADPIDVQPEGDVEVIVNTPQAVFTDFLFVNTSNVIVNEVRLSYVATDIFLDAPRITLAPVVGGLATPSSAAT